MARRSKSWTCCFAQFSCHAAGSRPSASVYLARARLVEPCRFRFYAITESLSQEVRRLPLIFFHSYLVFPSKDRSST
jgi:hypothetical protein